MGIYLNKRNETKTLILNTFWKLYQEKEISRITVRELTDTCGIHRSTFYLHYQDPYDILEQIEQQLLSQIQEVCNIQEHSEDAITKFAHHVSTLYENNRIYLHTLVYQRKDPVFSEAYRRELILQLGHFFILQDMEENAVYMFLKDRLLAHLTDDFIVWADEQPFSIEILIKMAKNILNNGYLPSLWELKRERDENA